MDNKRIKVEICIGTPCYLMGSQDLLTEMEHLPVEYHRNFTFKAKSCIDNNCDKAPVIRIGGTIYDNVNPEKMKDLLKQYLQKTRW